jgi:phospholipase/carboxylesterase
MTAMTRRRERLGTLDCQVVDSGPRPTLAMVLCHGFGAPGDDLVSLADAIVGELAAADTAIRFVFPAAPLQPPELAPYGGRAWWNINMAALLAASESKSFAQLHDATPPGIDRAADALIGCVEAALVQLAATPGADAPRYFLGGFSQGAMLTTHVALSGRLPAPDTLIQLSGTLICRANWQAALEAGRLAETDVIQSHGTIDPILPYSSAEVLRQLVQPHCRQHTFIPFHGPHTIPMQSITAIAAQV